MTHTKESLSSTFPNVPPSVIEDALKLMSSSEESEVLANLKELNDALEVSDEDIKNNTEAMENFVAEWKKKISHQERGDAEEISSEEDQQQMSEIENKFS